MEVIANSHSKRYPIELSYRETANKTVSFVFSLENAKKLLSDLDIAIKEIEEQNDKRRKKEALQTSIPELRPKFKVGDIIAHNFRKRYPIWYEPNCFIVSVDEKGYNLKDGGFIGFGVQDDYFLVGRFNPNPTDMDDMDKECIGICKLLNSLPTIQTFESCSGHLKDRFSVWFFCDSIEVLSRLGRAVEHNYSDGKWEVVLDSTDTHPYGVYWLRSKSPFQNYEEMNESLQSLIANIRHWFKDEFDSYFIKPEDTAPVRFEEEDGEKYPVADYKLIEQSIPAIQWKGNNLKDVIGFTGKSPLFDEWFKSWKEFEDYVHSHDGILKLFCEDGSHYEVPVGAWIVKTPDGYNIPSRFRFVQKPAEWSDTNELVFNDICKHLENEGYSGWVVLLNALRNGEFQAKQEWNEEDEEMLRRCINATFDHGYLKECDFLKSLRPQWKPSKEQMEALKWASECPSAVNHQILANLYNDLKKLM